MANHRPFQGEGRRWDVGVEEKMNYLPLVPIELQDRVISVWTLNEK